jgi:hypothetical protein
MAAKKMGRPLIQIPKEEFEKLCAIWCTLEEIAGFYDCSPDTIERWCKRTYKQTFADIYKRKSGTGAVSLRRKQFELAQAGDRVLLIWLGKQKLGQRDHIDIPPPPPPPENTVITLRFQDGDDNQPAAGDAAADAAADPSRSSQD